MVYVESEGCVEGWVSGSRRLSFPCYFRSYGQQVQNWRGEEWKHFQEDVYIMEILGGKGQQTNMSLEDVDEPRTIFTWNALLWFSKVLILPVTCGAGSNITRAKTVSSLIQVSRKGARTVYNKGTHILKLCFSF